MSGASVWNPAGFLSAYRQFLRVPVNEAVNEFPEAILRANKLMAFDSAGQPTVVSSTSSDLEEQLADGTDPTKGPGLIVHNPALPYDPDTVGGVLNDLQTQISSISGAGASFGLNLLNFIPTEEHAAIKNGTSTYDCTADIQEWINALSNSMSQVGEVPAGKYNHTTIYGYYDAALNPGFNVKRNAKLYIRGEGIMVEHYAYGEANSFTGTIFNCTGATGGWIFSPVALDANPFLSRDLIVESVAFTGAQNEYLVNARGVPTARFYNVEFVARSVNTGGLALTTCYFGILEKVRMRCTVAGNLSNAWYCSNNSADAPGAGLVKGKDLNISGFKNGFFFATGGLTTLTFDNSQISSLATGYNLFFNGTIDVLTFNQCQFEAPCLAWIKAFSAGYIKTLWMNSCWGLDQGTIGESAAIQLLTPDYVYISGVYQNMRKALCNVDALANADSSYEAKCIFSFFEASGTMRTMFTGRVPSVMSCTTGGAANARLTGSSNKAMVMKATGPGGSSFNQTNLAVGSLSEKHIVFITPATAPEYYHSAQGYPTILVIYNAAATDLFLDNGDTAGLGNGYRVTVVSKSTGSILVKNSSGGSLIGTVTSGTKTTFIWSTDIGGWI